MTDNISRRDAKGDDLLKRDDVLMAVHVAIKEVLGVTAIRARVGFAIEAALDKIPALDADGREFEFQVGQPVSKVTGDYRLDGIVRAAFTKASGCDRYVVEDDRGMLLIYGPANLVSRYDLTSGDAAQREE